MSVRRTCAPSVLPASSCLTGSVQPVQPTARSVTPLLNVSSAPKDSTWPSTEAVLPVRALAPVACPSMSAEVAPTALSSTP